MGNCFRKLRKKKKEEQEQEEVINNKNPGSNPPSKGLISPINDLPNASIAMGPPVISAGEVFFGFLFFFFLGFDSVSVSYACNNFMFLSCGF